MCARNIEIKNYIHATSSSQEELRNNKSAIRSSQAELKKEVTDAR
jgi:hypothetical protein